MGMYLAVQVGLGGLRRVQLKALPDTLAEDVTRGVRLHDLGHRLLNQRLQSREPVTVRRPQVVRQVHADHDTSRRGVDTHGVGDLENVVKTRRHILNRWIRT